MSAALATESEIKATGTPVLIQSVVWIFLPASSSFAITTILAVDHTGVIFHPNHTPNISAHQSIFVPAIHWASKYVIIGIIAIVIGILSTIEERRAVAHSTIIAVSTIFSATQPAMRLAK